MYHIREKYTEEYYVTLVRMELLSLKDDLLLLKRTLLAKGLKETTFNIPSLQSLQTQFDSRLKYSKERILYLTINLSLQNSDYLFFKKEIPKIEELMRVISRFDHRNSGDHDLLLELIEINEERFVSILEVINNGLIHFRKDPIQRN